jgi:hypothetical protein
MLLTWVLLVQKLSLLITDQNYFATDTDFGVLRNALLLDEDRESIVAMNHKSAEIIDRLKDERLWQAWEMLKQRQGQMSPRERICVDVKQIMDSVHALFEQKIPSSHTQ